ncbi:Wzz/FepE/Etk N-terminal domain-containing protein [Nocardiopsis sp. ATB16-24]|uniref:Wzz/FepE/Etk N-terminal domain-containing protein n=1 Tax=Nocardiopsis sp. ATB16-24 TaxID=3019555 RepID=UPI00255601A7|nr:Wzz/FepE/Etk N-terminal domain-containing protein [Nocardiopsis sp. ATB16-24]
MDTDISGPSGPELREYTALLRRRLRLIGAGVIGGLVLGAAMVVVLPTTYTSVTAVQVQPTGMDEFTGERSGRLSGDVNLDTEAQILISDQVSSVVAESLPGEVPAPTTDDLRERVEVNVPPNSNVLEIGFSASTPEAAQAGARSYADAYLEVRRAQVDALVDDRLEALRGEREDLYQDLAEAVAEEAAFPGANTRTEALREEITELGKGIGPLSVLRETVQAGRVLTPAGLPEEPSGPVPALWLVGGAALGLLAGLSAALVRDRFDPRLRDTEDTARVTRLPVLLDLSDRMRADGHGSVLLDDGAGAGQRVNELAHLMRARLSFGAPRFPGETEGDTASGHVLLVAATAPGHAGTTIAVALAAALARTGSETLLVCADPHGDTAANLLGPPEGAGLDEAPAEGWESVGPMARPHAPRRLRVLRHGSWGAHTPVQDTAMVELLRRLRTEAEYVVVAAAPVSERADVHALASSADMLLPVVEPDRTRRRDLTDLLTLAERLAVPVPGTAVLPRRPLADPPPAVDTSARVEAGAPVDTGAEDTDPTEDVRDTAAADAEQSFEGTGTPTRTEIVGLPDDAEEERDEVADWSEDGADLSAAERAFGFGEDDGARAVEVLEVLESDGETTPPTETGTDIGDTVSVGTATGRDGTASAAAASGSRN